MNQITTVPSRAPDARPAKSAALTVLANETTLLSLQRAVLDLSALRRELEREAERLPSDQAAALEASRLPSLADLERLEQQVTDALDAPPEPRATKILVGLMIDAFASSRIGQAETFIEALVHDVVDEGHSPMVVASACQRLRREQKFLPTIAEVLDACDAAKRLLGSMPTTIRMVADRKSRALRWIEQACAHDR